MLSVSFTLMAILISPVNALLPWTVIMALDCN